MVKLNSIFEINERIKALNLEKEFLEKQLNGERNLFVENRAEKESGIKLLEGEMAKEHNELCRERLDIYKAISRVTDKEDRTLLEYRYIYLMSCEDIAKAINYSLRHTMRKLHNAVKELEKVDK